VVESSGITSDHGPCCGQPGSADPATISLTRLRRGQTGVVREARLSGEDGALLRAMGLRPNARVRLCRVGEPCIVAVSVGLATGGGYATDGGCAGTCRIGLARPLAERIMVAVDA
jgi:Fe2+ transport system protein FeoA